MDTKAEKTDFHILLFCLLFYSALKWSQLWIFDWFAKKIFDIMIIDWIQHTKFPYNFFSVTKYGEQNNSQLIVFFS